MGREDIDAPARSSQSEPARGDGYHVAMTPEPDASPRGGRLGPGVVVTVAVGVVLLFLILLLDATRGHFVPQVVDLYLVLQYAAALAEGHPFQYNAGDAPTTGATSLLHTALLGAAHAAGVHGEGLVAFAVLFGAALLVVSAWLAWRAGGRLGGPEVAALSGLLVALGGPAAWGFLYGSDIALFMFLSLWLLERLLAEREAGAPRWSAAAATLLALARPEGLPIALALAGFWWLGPRPARGARDRAVALIPAAAGLGVLVLYRAVTGSWLGTSVADKSLVAAYGLPDALGLSAEYAQDLLRGVLLGFFPSQTPLGFARGWAPYYLPPLALVPILALLLSRHAAAVPARLWALIAAGVSLLVAPNLFMGVHYNRYLLWAVPGLLVLFAGGVSLLARGLARGDAALERKLFAAAAAVAIAGASLSTLRFAVAYGEMGGEVWVRDVALADWIRHNLPPGAHIANAATSVEYLTGHRNLNLHGVTSAGFIGPEAAEREAGMLEGLERLAPGARPPWLISDESRQEAEPTLQALAAGAPLFRTTSLLGNELLLFRTRWEAFQDTGEIRSEAIRVATGALREVDRLDLCDASGERRHAYESSSRLGPLRLRGAPHLDHYPDGRELLDAGRAIVGWESFEISGLQPGRDVLMVLRSAGQTEANIYAAAGRRRVALSFPEAGLRPRVDGQLLPRVSFRPGPGWSEHLLRLPGAAIGSERVRLHLEGRYAAFQYWFFQ